jgi:hypothetical protein
MDLQDAILKSEKWKINSSSMTDGIVIDSSARCRVPATLFHLSVEHQQSIHILITEKLYGSASALLRPQFEAYVRGIWYHHCASNSKLRSFLKGAEPPRISEMLTDIGKIPNFDYQILLETKQSVWSVLNEFTHGGSVQARARMTGHEIVSNYSTEHIVGMLRWSSTLSLMGYIGMANVAKNIPLANSLIDSMHSIYADAATTTNQTKTALLVDFSWQ